MAQDVSSLEDSAVVALTADGQRDLHEPGTGLTSGELEVLVLVDGHSSVAQLTRRAAPAARDVLKTRLHELLAKGAVRVTARNDDVIDPGDFFTLTPAGVAPQPSAKAQAAADATTEFLRRNGYCVNMARRGVVVPPQEGRALAVLVIDDDPDIGVLLRKYLKLEGWTTRTACNRDEILAAFRQTPLPDVVLLDVGLAEMNGFDLLAKLRRHPVLGKLPVIMLTAQANREVVLKGIAGGAAGHITKPFQIHPLVRAIKVVLGIEYDPNEQDWDLSL